MGGAGHMFLLKYNGRHGKKFGINGMIFGMIAKCKHANDGIC